MARATSTRSTVMPWEGWSSAEMKSGASPAVCDMLQVRWLMTFDELMKAWKNANETGLGDCGDGVVLYRYEGQIIPTDRTLDPGCDPIADLDDLIGFATYNNLLDDEVPEEYRHLVKKRWKCMKNTDVPIASTVRLLHDFNDGLFIFPAGTEGVVLVNDLVDDGIMVDLKVSPENVTDPEKDDSSGWWEVCGKIGTDFELVEKR